MFSVDFEEDAMNKKTQKTITQGDFVFCSDPRFPNLITKVVECIGEEVLIMTMNGTALIAPENLTKLPAKLSEPFHLHITISQVGECG